VPNRILKDTINESKGLSECSLVAQDFYKRLITYADDYGRFDADVEIMRARLYPRELNYVTEMDIEDWLVELAGVGKLQFYTASGHREIYGMFPNWKDHQRLRDSKAKTPEPESMAVNAWYLRRSVSLDMQAEVIEGGNFKCQLCGKFLTSCTDGRSIVKLGRGLFQIGHIIPVIEGGETTKENLRVLCTDCGNSQRKNYTRDEIDQFLANIDNPRQLAATRRNSPRTAAARGDPRPESNTNTNTNITTTTTSNARAREADDILSVTDEEVEDHRKLIERLEGKARDYGLPFAVGDIERTLRLVGEYSEDWVMQAIDRCSLRERRSWGTVQGILRSWKEKGGIDDGIPDTTRPRGRPGMDQASGGGLSESRFPVEQYGGIVV